MSPDGAITSPARALGGERPRIVELAPARRADAAALAAEAWDLPPAPGLIEARLSAPNARVIAAIDLACGASEEWEPDGSSPRRSRGAGGPHGGEAPGNQFADGGRIVGVATARILGGGRAVSDETVVHASWRGRGVAAAMIAALSVLLRGAGVRVLEGESSARRWKELEFFRRQGFHVTGVWRAHGVEGYADGESIFRTEKRLR